MLRLRQAAASPCAGDTGKRLYPESVLAFPGEERNQNWLFMERTDWGAGHSLLLPQAGIRHMRAGKHLRDVFAAFPSSFCIIQAVMLLLGV